MRELKTSDLFTFTKILKKMNLKNEIQGLAKDVTGMNVKQKKVVQQELYTNLAMLFIENIGNAEQEIYKFLGDLSNKKPEEIADQTPTKTINMLKELFNQEGFKDFLSLASK